MSSGDGRGPYVFALPPSLGRAPVVEMAERFSAHFAGSGIEQVETLASYGELETALLQGHCHAAWSPPIVCARIESAGGRVALRSVRYGSTTYRAVLLCRANDRVDLKELGVPGARKLRAVWVDEWSMGGCILPRYYLRSRGLELHDILSEQNLLESYGACFTAVLDGYADLTSSYATRRGLGYVDLCGDRAVELRALAYTDESPNDGIALSPTLGRSEADALHKTLVEYLAAERAPGLLSSGFDVNGFDQPPPGTYSALLSLL